MSESQKIRDFMAAEPAVVDGHATLVEVAQIMRDRGANDVLVISDGLLEGIITDRDITVRAVAAGLDAAHTAADQIASLDIAAVTPDDTVAAAIDLMRANALRHLPVVEDGHPCGIVSLNDLALALDWDSGPVTADSLRRPPA